MMDMLNEDAPDLLVAGFSEAHSAEHQFLNLTASEHRRYDPDVVAALGEAPLRAVYQAIDATIGRIVRHLPGETMVLVVCLGGLQIIHGGVAIARRHTSANRPDGFEDRAASLLRGDSGGCF